ncbi:hypothetical protein [Flavobacterium oreochromis]|uniref:Uncharacterized protein n=1 Tax=Flavobacterium oreochromis TaxID=2906078 RepID=A0ABW8PB95_9FLAO
MTKIIGCKFDRDEIVIYRHKKEIIDAHTQKLLEEERKKVRKDDVVVVDMGYTNHATFYLDASCFENEALVPNSKWAVVYQDAFAEAQIQHKTIPSSLWALNEGRVPIDYLGMKRHYKIGNSLTVKLLENSQSVYYYGYIQKVIVFTDRPEEGFSFSIIPVSRPRISFAYFENSEKNWRYGEIVNLSIHYHNLCTTNHDTLFSQVFIVEANEANAAIKAEEGDDIDLESLKESSVWQSGEFKMAQVDKKATGFNSRIPFSVLIDYEKWRKGEAKEKTFSLIVVVYRTEYPYNIKSEKVVSFRNFITNPTKDLYQYNPETLSLKDINIKEDAISSRIVVQKDFMSEILAKREIEVNNMIQYVGDIAYNRKEYDPCGYSKITIKDEDDDEREALVIFDENNIPAPKDQTEKIFGIIAGDKRKKISITIDQLKNKRVFCHGLLLEAGEDHSKQKNVFQVDKVYTAKKIRDKNNHEIYLEKKDHTHQEQLKKSNSPITKENKEDYDVIRTDNSYNPSAVQGWQEGLDYKFEGANQLVIMPSYIYNKAYESSFSQLLGYSADIINSIAHTKIQSTAWIARYMFMQEAYKQTYFLPISTCRYPNQLARIEVYPDFEWWINVKYQTKSPIYVNQKPNYKYRIFTTEEDQNKKLADARSKEHTGNWEFKEKKYELDFEACYKINGKEYSLIPGDSFPILNAIRFFLKSYELFKELSFVEETEEFEMSIASGSAKTFAGDDPERKMTERWKRRKAKGLPFRISVTMPSFSGGIYGKFAQSKKDTSKIGTFYNLEFAAKPLFGIEGKLDLLYFAQFIGPIGQVMSKISEVVKKVNYLTLGAVRIDYFLYVGAKADLNIELKALEYHSIDGWSSGEAQVYVPITLFLKSGVDVNVSLEGIASSDFAAEIDGKANLEIRATYDKRLNKSPAFIKFNGLDTKIIVKFSAKNKTNGDPEDPEEKVYYIKSIIDSKDPWKIDIL